MARKRGLIAELIHQQELAEKARQRANAEQLRAQQRALKLAEQTERHRIRMQELGARGAALAAAQATYEARLAADTARDVKIAADNEYATRQLALVDAIRQRARPGRNVAGAHGRSAAQNGRARLAAWVEAVGAPTARLGGR